jgi:hypothetical protein
MTEYPYGRVERTGPEANTIINEVLLLTFKNWFSHWKFTSYEIVQDFCGDYRKLCSVI